MGRFLFFLIVGSFVGCATDVRRTNDQDLTALSPKAALGRYLFFDTRLSLNNTKSCASCHDPQFAFSDGYRRSVTATGDVVLHNAPSLINAGRMKRFNWSAPEIVTLEKQHLGPLFAISPVELGGNLGKTDLIRVLMADTTYHPLFEKAFPGRTTVPDWNDIIICLADFVRTLSSANSQYDRYISGDSAALSSSARKGMSLFFDKRLGCASCHVPPMFTLASRTAAIDSIYVNIGLYNVNGLNAYPDQDAGLAISSEMPGNSGGFRIPSLRNVALTAPYFHDGSGATLEEVLDIYAKGGRNLLAGPFRGNGILNRNKDARIKGFKLLPAEKKALIDFLYSLSDSTISANPLFQSPFRKHH